jgi:hypothetical protein
MLFRSLISLTFRSYEPSSRRRFGYAAAALSVKRECYESCMLSGCEAPNAHRVHPQHLCHLQGPQCVEESRCVQAKHVPGALCIVHDYF